MKFLGINLIKEVKDMFPENYKTIMKEAEEDTNKCDEGVEKREPWCTVRGNVNWCSHYGKQSSKN